MQPRHYLHEWKHSLFDNTFSYNRIGPSNFILYGPNGYRRLWRVREIFLQIRWWDMSQLWPLFVVPHINCPSNESQITMYSTVFRDSLKGKWKCKMPLCSYKFGLHYFDHVSLLSKSGSPANQICSFLTHVQTIYNKKKSKCMVNTAWIEGKLG